MPPALAPISASATGDSLESLPSSISLGRPDESCSRLLALVVERVTVEPNTTCRRDRRLNDAGAARPLLEPLDLGLEVSLILLRCVVLAFSERSPCSRRAGCARRAHALITFQVSELGLQRFEPLAVIGSVTSNTGEV